MSVSCFRFLCTLGEGGFGKVMLASVPGKDSLVAVKMIRKDPSEALDILKEKTVAFFAAEMVCGIQFLHSQGIIHRDLKPDNVLLDGEGHLKICDFGLAAEGIFGDTLTTGHCGTLLYMALEILIKMEYGVAVDWWSFGVMLFWMLNGGFLFYIGCCRKARVQSIVFDAPKYTKELSQQSVDILSHLLRMAPQQRMMLAENIRQHPFFDSAHWDDIES